MLIGKEGLPIPNYSTLSRRQCGLPAWISCRLDDGENLVVGIDSTGLKVYGEGEWKVRKHGWSKHRTWSKLHICMDLDSQEILSVELTGNDEDDAKAVERILRGKSAKIKSFKADGAYDKFGFREVLESGVKQVIPPLKTAVVQKAKKGKTFPGHLVQRNQAVEYIYDTKRWKQKTGYHQRSLNEVAMFNIWR